MNLYLRKRKNFSKREMHSSLLSPNGQIYILQTFCRNVVVISTLLQKQLRNLKIYSHAYQFSPSSQQFAVNPFPTALIVVSIASSQKVYIKLQSDRAILMQIYFKDENMIIAVSSTTLEIFTVDIRTQVTTQIIDKNILHSCLDYGCDIVVLVEQQTNYLQVWNTLDGSKLFQSDPFTNRNKVLAIQLINSKNLILVNFFYYLILYQIDYQNKKIYPYEYQIPIHEYGYGGSQVHSDQIVTMTPCYESEQVLILFDQFDSPNTISLMVQIYMEEEIIQSFRSKNNFIIKIINYYLLQQQEHNLVYFLKIIQK